MSRVGRLFAAVTFLTGICTGALQAFEVQENWVGNEVRWEDGDLPVVWILDVRSINPGGARWRSIQSAVTEWNRTGGIRFLFTTTPNGPGGDPEDDLQFRKGDGKSEILFVDPSEIDGAAGRESTKHACAGCRRIVESDVAIADNLSLSESPQTSQLFSCTAHSVAVHELGHSIGLDHETGQLAMMQPICNDSPRVNGHEGNYMVLPDDQRGARQQYSSGGDETNLFTSAQMMLSQLPELFRDRYERLRFFNIIPSGGNPRLLNYGTTNIDKVANPDSFSCALFGGFDPGCQSVPYDLAGDPRAINLCPGQSFSVPFVVGNRANNPGTEKAHSIGFYLSQDTATAPFDPTSQFPVTPPQAGAIIDNEIEFDSTDTVTANGVQALTLSSDPDCAPEGNYRIWHGVDICHQFLEGNGTVQAGGILEDDNFVLTGVRVNVLAPDAPACTGLGLPASDGVCELAAIRKGCEGPPVEPPVEPPTECPEEGCGTQAGGLCLMVGEDPDGLPIGGLSTADRVLFDGSHPDGDQSVSRYCVDDPAVSGFEEMVCSGANETCAACDEGLEPGCTCDPDNAGSCGAGDLTCVPTTGYGNNQSFSSGRCWPAAEGVPSWECQADCSVIYGQTGYCHRGAQPWEGAGTPICANAQCSLGGVDCAQQGLACNVDTNQCEPECASSADCQARGYPDTYQCHTDSQRCFIAGVPHP